MAHRYQHFTCWSPANETRVVVLTDPALKMCRKANRIHCFILFSPPDLISDLHFSLSSVSAHFLFLWSGTLTVYVTADICFWPFRDKTTGTYGVSCVAVCYFWASQAAACLRMEEKHSPGEKPSLVPNAHVLAWGRSVGWSVFLHPGSSLAREDWWAQGGLSSGCCCGPGRPLSWEGIGCCLGKMSWRACAASDVLSSSCGVQ